MSSLEPTAEQLAAIRALDGDVVIAAGAGSGKTTVLARRFAYAVSPDDGTSARASVDEVLAITFTRKAAAELAERVRRVVVSEAARPALARRVDEAWISTIDSFCNRILRRHALEAGVDPYFRTISEVEAGILRDQALSDVLRCCRQHGGGAFALLEMYGADTLRRCVSDTHERVRRMGLSVQEIEPLAADLEPALSGLRTAAGMFRDGIEACGLDVPTRCANHEACGAVLESLASASAPISPDDGRELLISLTSVKFNAGAKPAELARAAKDALQVAVEAVAGLALAPHAAAFVALVREFDGRYTIAKQARGVMDFADVADATARLFQDSPPTARRYRDAFKLLMIDEFQDTNGLQMNVVEPIRDGNLCVVGDDKQAIYAWRYADVGLFERLASEVDRRLPLARNFRSHPEVLDFVNEVFSGDAFFGESLMRLEPFREGGVTEAWPDGLPRIEAVVVDGRTAGALRPREAEAREVALRVRELVDRGVDPAGIVVLLRAMTNAPVYAEAIRDRGVDVYLASGELFFGSAVVTDLRALLKVLVLPEDDEALVRVLGGPLVGLDDDTLMAIRRLANDTGRRTPLWKAVVPASRGKAEGVTREQAQRLSAAIEVLVGLRGSLTRCSVADLLREAAAQFDYDLTLLASGREGAREWRNVLKLVRMAAEWEALTPGDPGAFLAYLDEHERHVSREAAAPLATEEAAVRIMSVHSAKGLEFPVVFFADLGKGANDREAPHFLVDRLDGRPMLGIRFPSDGSGLDRVAGPGYERLREASQERSREEELRIAYVACTRAREALFLVGSTPANAKTSAPRADTHLHPFFRAFGAPEATAELVLGSGLRVPWTLVDAGSPDAPAARRSPEGTSSLAVPVSDALDRAEDAAERSMKAVAVCAGPVLLPETVSYSSLKSYDACPYRFYIQNVLGLAALRDPAQARATELGKAVHSVLEAGAGDGPVEAAMTRFGLSEGEADRLRTAVAAYRTSEVASEVATAERVSREHPFGLPLGPVRLVGSMDLLAWTGSDALVVDYKTGRDPGWSLSEHQREAYGLQARCYALAAFAAGAQRVRARFVFVELEARTVDLEFRAEEADAIRAEIGGRVVAMERGEYAPLETYRADVCGECVALGGLCPVDRPGC
ncbi:MAG: hypothetical protein C0418_00050 [Coriobacteriaceae bacterium]|nr:hypothetical protein [Coriobacteriaceae bacterium]